MLKPLLCSGYYFVLYNGFCVLKATVPHKKKEVFAATLIKKHFFDFWLVLVLGAKNKIICLTDLISGILDEMSYNILCIMELKRTTTIMDTNRVPCSEGMNRSVLNIISAVVMLSMTTTTTS